MMTTPTTPHTALLVWAGIGSRDTPSTAQRRLTDVSARIAAAHGWLRSGDAVGADRACAAGVPGVPLTEPESVARPAAEIILPWRPTEKHPTSARAAALVLFDRLPRAHQDLCLAIAARHHPAWEACSRGDRMLLARNVIQVLGRPDATGVFGTPSDVVIAWAPQAKTDAAGRVTTVKGGTGLAVRLAHTVGIPVLLVGRPDHEAVLDALPPTPDPAAWAHWRLLCHQATATDPRAVPARATELAQSCRPVAEPPSQRPPSTSFARPAVGARPPTAAGFPQPEPPGEPTGRWRRR